MFKVLRSHCNKAENIYLAEEGQRAILCLLYKLGLGGEEGKNVIVNCFHEMDSEALGQQQCRAQILDMKEHLKFSKML